jgi:hypothetical protein
MLMKLASSWWNFAGLIVSGILVRTSSVLVTGNGRARWAVALTTGTDRFCHSRSVCLSRCNSSPAFASTSVSWYTPVTQYILSFYCVALSHIYQLRTTVSQAAKLQAPVLRMSLTSTLWRKNSGALPSLLSTSTTRKQHA